MTTILDKYIKVNIPLTEEEYIRGNGEGVWVEVDSDTRKAYDKDVIGTGYQGILANDSCYYPGLSCGAIIPFEMRGEKRPVVDYHNFLKDRTKLTEAGKVMLLRKISENQ